MSIFAEIFGGVNLFVYICIQETKKETNNDNTMKTKTTTTTEMRKAAHKLITLCNQFDKTGDELCKAQNARDYAWAQEGLYDKAREIEDLFGDLISELNVILCAGDAIDIHDYYRLRKEPIKE